MDRITRLRFWRLLQGEAFEETRYERMIADAGHFLSTKEDKTKFYFACGHDVGKAKYKDWVLCDLRDIEGCLTYDILLGFPFKDGALEKVKSKLALGMFTYNQARFVLYETARTLMPGGTFECNDRDFDKLLERRPEMNWQLFNRYVNGNGMYYGSQRKSIWTAESVIALAAEFHLDCDGCAHNGMNFTIKFTRLEGNLRPFGPEPSLKVDDDGNMINDGGDFPNA